MVCFALTKIERLLRMHDMVRYGFSILLSGSSSFPRDSAHFPSPSPSLPLPLSLPFPFPFPFSFSISSFSSSQFFLFFFSIKKLIDDCVLSWSCRNIVAFTAIGNPNSPEEREVYRPTIHIVDPDRPWEVCRYES